MPSKPLPPTPSTEALQPVELFYARPSLGSPALLRALAEAAAGVAGQAAGGLTRPNDQGVDGVGGRV